MSIVVATWNVQWQFGDWQQRQPAILQTLQSLDADIVTLQESWPSQVDGFAQALGYDSTWAGHQRSDDDDEAMGNAVLSRWPISERAHRFLTEPDGHEYRTVVGARIGTPAGTLPLFTTHLNHRFDQSTTRVAQLQAVSEFVQEHGESTLPPILTGDMNAIPDSDEIRKLTGRTEPYVAGRVWTDSWEQVGHGPGYTWSVENPHIIDSAWPNRRLDYVLVGWPRHRRPIGNPLRAWLVGSDPVGGITASDHFGVAVEIQGG